MTEYLSCTKLTFDVLVHCESITYPSILKLWFDLIFSNRKDNLVAKAVNSLERLSAVYVRIPLYSQDIELEDFPPLKNGETLLILCQFDKRIRPRKNSESLVTESKEISVKYFNTDRQLKISMVKNLPTFKEVPLNAFVHLLSSPTIETRVSDSDINNSQDALENQEANTLSSDDDEYSCGYTLPTNYSIAASTELVNTVLLDAFDLIIPDHELHSRICSLLRNAQGKEKKTLAIIKLWMEFGCLSYKELLDLSKAFPQWETLHLVQQKRKLLKNFETYLRKTHVFECKYVEEDMTTERKGWMLIHKIVYHLWKQDWSLLKSHTQRGQFRCKCLSTNLEFFVTQALQSRGSNWEVFLLVIKNTFFMEEYCCDMIKIVEWIKPYLLEFIES